MLQFGTSEFNTAVCCHKLGDVEYEYTCNSRLFAILSQKLSELVNKIIKIDFIDKIHEIILYASCT